MDAPDPEKKTGAPRNDPATPESDDDFWNCKGRCGYTRWCAACMAERRKAEIEEEWRRYREESGEEGTPP